MGKILLVDDNEDLCEPLSIFLQSEGHQVTIALDGLAALHPLHAHDRSMPDLIITDIQLPKLHGLAVISRIRAVRPDAKIIAVSADDWRLKIAKALGAMIALEKPVSLPALGDQLDLRERGDRRGGATDRESSIGT